MTEEKIFNFLLPQRYDYPKLHPEAAKIISSKLADVIYDTLKLKSTLPINKRLNVLKYVQNVASNSDSHVNVNQANYLTFIDSFRHRLNKPNFDEFLLQNGTELEESPHANLCVEIKNFYKLKNERHRNRIKQIEMILKCDQETLENCNLGAKITRNIFYYETGQDIIDNLFGNGTKAEPEIDVCVNTEYREKQIKFAYALVYLKQLETLKQVLYSIAKYQSLLTCEINFLVFLNEADIENNNNLRQLLLEKFFFIYEKVIIGYCTELIQMEVDQIPAYFPTVSTDTNFLIIKELCNHNLDLELKLKNMLYELYCYSYCNENILQFIEFLLK